MSSNNTERVSFASKKDQLEYPDFLEIQLKSFSEFFQLGTTPENRRKEGLYQVFMENFPITDTRNNFVQYNFSFAFSGTLKVSPRSIHSSIV